MNLRDVPRELLEIPLNLIDRPNLDARIERDPNYIRELGRDIASRGLIYPLVVFRAGERYELVDGFTRYLAMVGEDLIVAPCIVYPSKDTALEGVKWAANIWRLEMTPCDEAVMFHELLAHECGGDIEKLAALTRKKPSYLDNRLALLSGDADVFEALRKGDIKIGVAHELNRVPDEGWRRWYLKHAIKDGASVSVVSGWVTDWMNTHGEQAPQAAPAAGAPEIVPGPAYDPHRCHICRKSDPRFIPEQVPVHTHCRLAILDPMIDAYHGAPVDQPVAPGARRD